MRQGSLGATCASGAMRACRWSIIIDHSSMCTWRVSSSDQTAPGLSPLLLPRYPQPFSSVKKQALEKSSCSPAVFCLPPLPLLESSASQVRAACLPVRLHCAPLRSSTPPRSHVRSASPPRRARSPPPRARTCRSTAAPAEPLPAEPLSPPRRHRTSPPRRRQHTRGCSPLRLAP